MQEYVQPQRATWQPGEQSDTSLAGLVAAVESELAVLAQKLRRGYSPAPSLETVELVSEMYMRLVGGKLPEVRDHDHFFCIAARTMRWILVERYRRRRSLLETDLSSDGRPVLEGLAPEVGDDEAPDLEALDLALAELGEVRPRLAQVVELSYFLGLGVLEIAEVLGSSERTVFRDLERARAWLHWRMVGGPEVAS